MSRLRSCFAASFASGATLYGHCGFSTCLCVNSLARYYGHCQPRVLYLDATPLPLAVTPCHHDALNLATFCRCCPPLLHNMLQDSMGSHVSGYRVHTRRKTVSARHANICPTSDKAPRGAPRCASSYTVTHPDPDPEAPALPEHVLSRSEWGGGWVRVTDMPT